MAEKIQYRWRREWADVFSSWLDYTGQVAMGSDVVIEMRSVREYTKGMTLKCASGIRYEIIDGTVRTEHLYGKRNDVLAVRTTFEDGEYNYEFIRVGTLDGHDVV